MKIELKLSPRQLNTLVYCFNTIQLVFPKERKQRVLNSVLEEIIVKIKKKHIEVESSLTRLFEKPKTPKFTLKYHEADALEQYLLTVENTPLNDYDRNAIRLIITKLNQQLA